jgi:hypothetical protein
LSHRIGLKAKANATTNQPTINYHHYHCCCQSLDDDDDDDYISDQLIRQNGKKDERKWNKLFQSLESALEFKVRKLPFPDEFEM